MSSSRAAALLGLGWLVRGTKSCLEFPALVPDTAHITEFSARTKLCRWFVNCLAADPETCGSVPDAAHLLFRLLTPPCPAGGLSTA